MTESANRMVAVVVGGFFVLFGGLGFTATGGVGFVSSEGGRLFGVFELNPLHNVIHLLIGAALVIAALSGVRAARTANLAVGTLLLLIGIAGLFVADTPFNLLALNTPDHALHFAGAVLLLAAGLGADKPAGA